MLLLVTFPDVFTSSVYLGIVNRQFTTALTDPSSTEFKELSADIVALVRNDALLVSSVFF